MIIGVVFKGSTKIYYYNTNLPLLKDGIYDIIVDGYTTYDNHIKVCDIKEKKYDKRLRTITDAKLVQAPRKPTKPYKNIYVDEKKRTICVVWKDGTKTVMKAHPDDEWDVEKGIALCFMKKVFNNRGCYYDTFKDVTLMGE